MICLVSNENNTQVWDFSVVTFHAVRCARICPSVHYQMVFQVSDGARAAPLLEGSDPGSGGFATSPRIPSACKGSRRRSYSLRNFKHGMRVHGLRSRKT